jgi:hypothetical protein
MSVTYMTIVNSMLVAKSLNGYNDVVTSINWQVLATDGTYSAQSSGTTAVGPVDPADFTPYPDLTEEHVLTWIPDPATTELKATLADNIAAQASAVVLMSPPWG